MRYLWIVLKVLVSIPFVLLAIAMLLTGNYIQAATLILIVIALFSWPFFQERKRLAISSRIGFISILLVLQFTVFKGDPKESIYLSEALKEELYDIYELKLSNWPEGTEEINIETEYGTVHVLAYGEDSLPPILLFHAASMGAHSWAENLPPLQSHYRIYAIDNIGEGNLSELDDPLAFPKSPGQIADLYAFIAEKLGVQQSPVIGASNGGFIAQAYAYHYPERVESMVLIGPMGITPLTGNSIFMLSAASLFPLNFVRDKVTYWAFGDDPVCHKRYGDWFDVILKGTIPSVARPVPMTEEQKAAMQIPVLLFLGTSDPIVGDAETARVAAEDYPNIEIVILDSGHMIGVEERDIVNKRLVDFLDISVE
jgi:pimeloyl-ACP methyl ester carboxylesterase